MATAILYSMEIGSLTFPRSWSRKITDARRRAELFLATHSTLSSHHPVQANPKPRSLHTEILCEISRYALLGAMMSSPE
jgi:hypothetical protein